MKRLVKIKFSCLEYKFNIIKKYIKNILEYKCDIMKNVLFD